MKRLLKKSFLFGLPFLFTSVIIAQPVTQQPASAAIDSNILVVVNGKVAGTVRELKKGIHNMFPEEMIESMNVWKGADAIKKYGEKGKSGVIEFFLKKEFAVEQAKKIEEKKESDDENKIFDKVEVEASFPGGDQAWRKYLERTLNASVPVDNNAPTGKYTVYVQFIVNKDGVISDAKALTNLGFGMEKEVLRVITQGPKWSPAIQNTRIVKAYRKQPVTFVVEEDGLNVSVKGRTGYILAAGKDNELSVSVDKVKDEDLVLSITGGSVTRTGEGVYKIKAPETGRVILTITYTQKKKKQTSSVSFEVQ